MESSNNHHINILDFPDEILLSIFDKLNMIDVFYSLVYVNKRFNRLTLNPFHIYDLDLTVKRSLLERVSPLDPLKINTICKKIFPEIHHHIYKLAVPSYLIESVINIDYPELQSLSLVNFEEQKLLEYLTEETTIYRLLTNQIRHLNGDIVSDKNQSIIFLLILSLGKHLNGLTFHNQFSSKHLGNRTFIVSSSLTKLIINVITFDDCLYLLNGNLQSLTVLIIDIYGISESSSIIDNTKELSKLKQFSLTSNRRTFAYDEKIVPLLRRMRNIEDLTLFLYVGRLDCNYTYPDKYINAYIDGTHLYNDVLAFMPQIHKFAFSINSCVPINSIGCPSNDDNQRSFIEKGNRHVGSYVHNRLEIQTGQCHVFSLPYQFDNYLLVRCNSFQGVGIFDKVRSMKMWDSYPFEHELFQTISQHFPFLRNLTLDNDSGQDNKQHSFTNITFPYLEHLDIMFAHADYAEQFLFEKNTFLPRLLELHIGYDTLTMITNNFTNNLSRVNCSKIRLLVTKELRVPPKEFYSYFPLLKI